MLAFKKMKVLLVFFLAFVLAFLPLLLGQAQAASLGSTTFFFEKMEVNTTNVGLVVTLKPNSNFDSGGQLKISFPDSSSADWCKLNAQSLTVTGISQAPVGSIDSALPGTLSGVCNQDAGGDYVVITGIGALTANVSYGLEISPNANFSTGPDRGRNRVSLELSSGSNLETKLFSIYLLSSDTVGISAHVSDADSVVCSLSTSEISLGVLYRGGSFVTSSHSLGTSTTTGSKGYYWTVFGKGNDQYAGLYNVGSGHIIRSLGTTVNLLSGEGFGLVVNPPAGSTVPASFQEGSFGIFGSISPGFDQAKLILYRETEQTAHEDAVITLGARASLDSSVGSYQELLTYSCGGYIGGYTPLQLVIVPEVLNFGEGETEKTFAISNSGSGFLEWEIGTPSYVVGGSNWVADIDPGVGKTRTSTDTISVVVDQTNVNEGEHTAEVGITSLGGGSGLLTINLSRVVILAELTTKEPFQIESTSAKSGGIITNDGGSSIIARGVCYGTSTAPSLVCTSDGIGVGDFNSDMISLTPGTRYFVRAFAENSLGVSYGNEHEFITKALLVADPASRDWGNTNVNVNISTTGSEIKGIEYCWTEESSCVPSTYVELLSVDTVQEGTGAWNLCYRSKDVNDVKGTISCSGEYRIDKVDPIVAASNSGETWYETQRIATVFASDEDSGIAEVRYSWETNDMNLDCTTGGTITANNAELNAPAGGTILYLCTRDNASNTATWSGTYNWTGSEPLVGAPEIYSGNVYNSTIFNGTISLRSSVTDQGGSGLNATSCEVSINSGNWFGIGVTYAAGYCQLNDYTPSADFTISFRIQDNAENTGTSSLGSFTYDNTAPTTTATLTSPPAGAGYTCGEWTAENVGVTLSCADNVGGSGCEASSPLYCADTENTCTPTTSYSIPLEISTSGISYLRYYSSDNLSNDETVQSCEVKIDNVGPTVTFTNTSSALSYYNGTTFAAVTNPVKAQDTNSGLKTFRYEWTALATDPIGITSSACTGGTAVTLTEGTLEEVLSTASVSRPTTSSDSHYLHVCAENVSSNITKDSSLYYLDVDNPELSASNASSTWYSTQRTATVSAIDAHSGIAEVRYSWGANDMNGTCDAGGTVTTHGATLDAPSGGTTLYLCARDNASNIATWSGVYNWQTVYPEVGTPEIYSGNVDQLIYFNGTISLRSSVTDQSGNGLNTTSCEVSINAGAYTGTGVTYDSGYCQYNDYTPNANFTIKFRVADNNAETGESTLGSFTYDPDLGKQELMGFAWSDSIGWINFSCENDDECLTSDYYVTALGSNLTGNAWSENFGWLSFDPDMSYHPTALQENAKIDFDGIVCGAVGRTCGWARFCSGTVNNDCASADIEGGWDGWVNLGPVNTNYVEFNDLTGDFSGSAWDIGELEEINFNCADKTSCATSAYKVFFARDDVYTVTYTSSANGTVSPASRQVKYYRTSAAPTVTPDAGYSLGNFEVTLGEGNGYLNTATGEVGGVTGDMTVRANFVDTTPPVVSASNASETWYETPRTATISATDAESGLAEVRYSWGTDDMNVTCDAGGTVTTHAATLDAPSGGTTLYLCARDNVGNASTWSGTYNWSFPEQELMGFAWSDSLGWINFSCENDDECLTSDYYVAAQGPNLTGSAWSESAGWLSFDPDMSYHPTALQENAKIDQDGTVCGAAGRTCGWARFCSGTVNNDCASADIAGDWDGWINLGPVNTNYVEFDDLTGDFSGSAWNIGESEEMSFNCANKTLCATSAYKVFFARDEVYTITYTSGPNGEITPSLVDVKYYRTTGTPGIIPDLGWGIDYFEIISGAGNGYLNTFTGEVGGVTGNMTIKANFRDEYDPVVSASNASETWYSTQRTATISATDAQSGLAEVRYSWGTNDMNAACDSGGTVTTHGATLDAPSGGTTLYLCARDNTGNTATWSGTYNWMPPLMGFAWSDSIGWVNFSCENDDECLISDYAVTVEASNLTGYAWSENVGWLSFDPDMSYHPSAPQNSARIDFDGTVCGAAGRTCGWARFCSGTVNNDCASADIEGDWDGWINLGPVNTNYVEFDDLTGDFSGSAWDIGELDEMSFNCADKLSCATSAYKVHFAKSDVYTITYTSDGSGEVSPTSRQVKYYRTSAAPTVTPDAGYSFGDFEITLGAGNGYLNTATGEVRGVTGDMTVRANFVDTTPPVLSASNASQTWYGTQRTATISAIDAESGLAEVRYSWGTDDMNVTCDTGGTVTTHGAILSAPSGGTTLYLCARDNVANTATWSGTYNWELGAAVELMGFAWSDNLGWINFNCLNDDECLTSDYSVIVDSTDLTGYAWSEHAGWLSFDPDMSYHPTALQESAQLDSDGTVCGAAGRACGWARFCSGTVNNDCASADIEGDWDGWVNLGPVNTNYVEFDDLTGDFSGSAWDIAELDEISFNCADKASCATNAYKVFVATAEVYTITYTSGANGGVSPASRQVKYYRTSAAPTATPDSGYVLDNFEVTLGAGNGYLNTATGEVGGVTGDMTITANFREADNDPPTITFVNDSHPYYKYDQAMFTAVTNPVAAQDTASGLKTFRYQWTTTATDPTGITSAACTGGAAVTLTQGTTAEVVSTASTGRPTASSDSHYLHVCAVDADDNIAKSSSRYYLDFGESGTEIMWFLEETGNATDCQNNRNLGFAPGSIQVSAGMNNAVLCFTGPSMSEVRNAGDWTARVILSKNAVGGGAPTATIDIQIVTSAGAVVETIASCNTGVLPDSTIPTAHTCSATGVAQKTLNNHHIRVSVNGVTNGGGPNARNPVIHFGDGSSTSFDARLNLPLGGTIIRQEFYRFFENANSTDVGTPIASSDTPAVLSSAGQNFRLRMLLTVSDTVLPISGKSFKLQVAAKDTYSQCWEVLPEAYKDVSTVPVGPWALISSLQRSSWVNDVEVLDFSEGWAFWAFASTDSNALLYGSNKAAGLWTQRQIHSIGSQKSVMTTSLLEDSSKNIYWSFGGDGNARLYASTNGGDNWTQKHSLTTGWVRDDALFEASNGYLYWAYGNNAIATLYRSIDGGANWTSVQAITATNSVLGMALMEDASGNIYWSYGSWNNSAYLRRSTDNGATWSATTNVATGNYVDDTELLKASNGYLYWAFASRDTTARIYRSINGGTTWTEVKNITTGGASYTTSILETSDGYLFWSFGSDDNNAYIYRSTDDGANWTLMNTITTTGDVRSGGIFQNHRGTIYWYFSNDGASGTAWLYTSDNAGVSWTSSADLGLGNTIAASHMIQRANNDILWSAGSNNNYAYMMRSITLPVIFHDNATPAHGATLTSNANDPVSGNTIINQTYNEDNPFTNSVSAIGIGEDGMWDFSLVDASAPAGYNYCFRAVESNGKVLRGYRKYPEIQIYQGLGGSSFSFTSSSLLSVEEDKTELLGYAWTDTIGWISFNCKNNDSCNEKKYGVEKVGSNLRGYAWNDEVQLLNFDPSPDLSTGKYPAEPQHTVQVDGDGNLYGWARFCGGTVNNDCASETRADWDGWVYFDSGENGAYIDSVDDTLHGWAWGSDYIGWISFNCENDNSCSSVPYSVSLEKDDQSAAVTQSLENDSTNLASRVVEFYKTSILPKNFGVIFESIMDLPRRYIWKHKF